MDVRVFSGDPGDDVLLAGGPAMNVIEVATQGGTSGRGRQVLGLVGSVINDRGAPNVAAVLESGIEDIFSRYGGFKTTLGEGAAAGYEGNLAAQCWRLSVPTTHIVPVDLAIKTATIATGTDLEITFTRSLTTYGETTVPAGFRVDDGAGYILATLEDVYYGPTESGTKSVRAREVSSGVAPTALNTVIVLVDTPADANVTCNTAAITVPDEVDAAELILRYGAAFDAINENQPGQQIDVIACDRHEAGIIDLLTAHCSTSTAAGFWRICCVSPPIGVAAADARTGGTDSVDRAGMTQARAAYVHQAWARSFPIDSDNLISPAYTASFPGAIVAAARIVQEKPEQNPGRPHQSLKNWGATGFETLVGGSPNNRVHWEANIMQPIFERTVNGTMSASYHDGIMADGTKIADRRMRDYLQQGLVIVMRTYHKMVAIPANRDSAHKAALGFLYQLTSPSAPSRARIGASTVTQYWDAANNHMRLVCVITLLGNMDTITLHVDAQTSNADVVVTEVS